MHKFGLQIFRIENPGTGCFLGQNGVSATELNSPQYFFQGYGIASPICKLRGKAKIHTQSDMQLFGISLN
jgi:hypothetical protein